MKNNSTVRQAIRLGSEAIAVICTQVEAWAERIGKPKRTDLLNLRLELDEQIMVRILSHLTVPPLPPSLTLARIRMLYTVLTRAEGCKETLLEGGERPAPWSTPWNGSDSSPLSVQVVPRSTVPVPQALIGDEMRKGYHTIVSKHERGALLGPIRDRVMTTFAGEGTTWSGRSASSSGSNGATTPKYDVKEVKVALKVCQNIPSLRMLECIATVYRGRARHIFEVISN